MQVLSRVLAYAVDTLGRIAGNPCQGIKRLYTGDRSEIIWTDADIAHLKAGGSRKSGGKIVELPCPTEMVHAVDLAWYTGLREGDLARLSWPHVREGAIILASGKSGGRREAIIPLYDELRDVLVRIPKRSTTILTNHRGRPWKPNSLAGAFIRAKASAGMNDRDLHFHDLRGTAATRFYVAGLSIRVTAEILAWSEDQVEKIIGATWLVPRRQRPRSASSTRPAREHRLQNLLQNCAPKMCAKYWSG
jgi:integrase